MPVIQTAPDLQTWYRVDDFTDPWTQAPWIVLMHGVAENSDAWYGWIPHLARRYRVLRFDVRGFGRSSAMPRDYDWPFERIGDDLAELTAQLKIDSFHLVSAKVGGTMALHLQAATRMPARACRCSAPPLLRRAPTDSGYSSKEIDEQGRRPLGAADDAQPAGKRAATRSAGMVGADDGDDAGLNAIRLHARLARVSTSVRCCRESNARHWWS